jgi:hypothetical protein
MSGDLSQRQSRNQLWKKEDTERETTRVAQGRNEAGAAPVKRYQLHDTLLCKWTAADSPMTSAAG